MIDLYSSRRIVLITSIPVQVKKSFLVDIIQFNKYINKSAKKYNKELQSIERCLVDECCKEIITLKKYMVIAKYFILIK